MLSLLVNLTDYRERKKEFRTVGFVPTGGKLLANPQGWGFNSANSGRGPSGRASRHSKTRAPRRRRPRLAGPALRTCGAAPNSDQAQRPAGTTRARGTRGQRGGRAPRLGCGASRALSPGSHPLVKFVWCPLRETYASPSAPPWEGQGRSCGGTCQKETSGQPSKVDEEQAGSSIPGLGCPSSPPGDGGGRAVPSPKRPGEPGDLDTLGDATHVFLVKPPFGDGTVPSHLLLGLSERV